MESWKNVNFKGIKAIKKQISFLFIFFYISLYFATMAAQTGFAIPAAHSAQSAGLEESAKMSGSVLPAVLASTAGAAPTAGFDNLCLSPVAGAYQMTYPAQLVQSSQKSKKSRIPERIPFSLLFHDFGKNTLGSFTYGYGLPWVAGTAGSYGIIQSGIDWEWNRFNVRHEFTSEYVPLLGVGAGSVLPALVPFMMYFGIDDPEIQFTGLALGQAALQGVLVSSMVKTFTGRVPPHIGEAIKGDSDYQEDYSKDFRWGFFRGGIKDGWPSGHTSVAVAMSTTLITLYPDNLAIRLGAIAYSTFVGASMSFRAHWVSDVFAGAFAGFAIGRTVGKNYAALRDKRNAASQSGKTNQNDKISLNFYPNGLGIQIKL